MDKEPVEEDVIDIESIDIIDTDNVVVLTDKTEGTRETRDSEISDDSRLKTGSIIAQFFNLFAQIREKEFWQLNTSEINSLNKTCPKILPKIVSDHSGIIGCALSLLGIIVKRIKLEKEDALNYKEPELDSSIDVSTEIYPKHNNDEIIETASLTGARST